MNIDLGPSWHQQLQNEFEKPYMKRLKSYLTKELEKNKTIYPPIDEFFTAFNSSPFYQTKVVIIGQDPYHGHGQAHGLCFSVRPDVRIPPSLKNIYKELNNDLGIPIPQHGYLQSWADQGVLLLNSVLSVEKAKAGSHQKQGWESFTDKVIEVLNHNRQNLVFILWGGPAQKKGKHIDQDKHLVIKGVHPSPLSAYRGFFGGNYFSKTNRYLKAHGISPIQWRIPEL